MPKVSTAFFAAASLFLLTGMGMGIFMGVNQDFSLTPAHAHVNLLGWATLGIFGAFYGVAREGVSLRLAWSHFVLSTSGALMMPLGLALNIAVDEKPAYHAITDVGVVLAVVGLLIFIVCVFRVLFGRASLPGTTQVAPAPQAAAAQ